MIITLNRFGLTKGWATQQLQCRSGKLDTAARAICFDHLETPALGLRLCAKCSRALTLSCTGTIMPDYTSFAPA